MTSVFFHVLRFFSLPLHQVVASGVIQHRAVQHVPSVHLKNSHNTEHLKCKSHRRRLHSLLFFFHAHLPPFMCCRQWYKFEESGLALWFLKKDLAKQVGEI